MNSHVELVIDNGQTLDIVKATVDTAFANYVADILKCVCCLNNYNDPDGHFHNEYCNEYGEQSS